MAKLLPLFFPRAIYVLEPLEPRWILSAGFLDPAIVPGGAATLDTRLDIDFVYHPPSLIQPDGKVIVAGQIEFSKSDPWCRSSDFDSRFAEDTIFIRFNTDGSRDRSFGRDGVVFACQEIYPWKLVYQPDGNILVHGSEGRIHRLTADGRIDDTFHFHPYLLDALPPNIPHPPSGLEVVLEGIAQIGFSHNVISTILFAPDGKMIVGGQAVFGAYHPMPLHLDFYARWTTPVVARFNSDGSVDESFGDGGLSLVDIVSEFGGVASFSFQSDGKLLALLYAEDEDKSNHFLARFNTDGSIDSSFGVDGIVAFQGPDWAENIVQQPDGKIVHAIFPDLNSPQDEQLILWRLNPDGTPDRTFGHNGRAISRWPGFSYSGSLLLQPDGKLLIINASGTIARFNSDGSLDTSFGFGGSILLGSQRPDDRFWLFDPILTPDGHLLVPAMKTPCSGCDGLSMHILGITTSADQPSRFATEDLSLLLRPFRLQGDLPIDLSPSQTSPALSLFDGPFDHTTELLLDDEDRAIDWADDELAIWA